MSRTNISYSSAYVRGSGGGSCVDSIGVEGDFGGGCGFGVGGQYGGEKGFLKNVTDNNKTRKDLFRTLRLPNSSTKSFSD